MPMGQCRLPLVGDLDRGGPLLQRSHGIAAWVTAASERYRLANLPLDLSGRRSLHLLNRASAARRMNPKESMAPQPIRREPGAVLYTAREAARILRCSEWWIKEQARKRRIPFSRVGGRYLFTEDHLNEIIRLFEVRPLESSRSPLTGTKPMPRRATNFRREQQGSSLLRARPPRRASAVDPGSSAA
jgi:excisionase family DNA binding protein